MSILFFTTRNVTSNMSAGLLANLAILEKESNDIDFLMSTKTDKSAKHIRSVTGLPIRKSVNLFGQFYETSGLTMASWKEIYDALDVSGMKQYSGLYIMGGLLHPSANVYRFSSKLPNFLDSALCITFRQVGNNIINILGILKAHKEYGIPLHEFSYDSDELCCSLISSVGEYYQYHIYDIPRYNMKRLDGLLYHLQKAPVELEETTKVFDLTFGYTVFPNGNRPSFVEYVNDMAKAFEKVNLYTINKLTGEDNSIPREMYLNKIKQSRFTLIIPSYDKNCFSLYRFIESIHNDCLPLIHKDCFTEDVEKSFDVKFDQLINRIPTESERLELLHYYKEKMSKPKFTFGQKSVL